MEMDIAHLRQGFDIAKDPVLHDITLVLGFINSLALVLRIKHRGLSWWALPCQSFTCMSYSQHRRSFFSPYGCCEFPFVVNGNVVCTRTCLLILVSIARSVTWFIENPLRSAVHSWAFYQSPDGNEVAPILFERLGVSLKISGVDFFFHQIL